MKKPYLNKALPVLLTISLVIPALKVSAQAPPVMWQRCYGGDSSDAITCIRQTADGGYIAAGATRSIDGDLSGNAGIKGLWVLKLDGSGNITWEKTYNDTLTGTNYIEPTYDGGYIVTGSQTVKLDNSGNIQWVVNIFGYVIHQTTDSGYIIASGETPALVKLGANGSVAWQQVYDGFGDIVNVYDVCQSFHEDGYMIAGSVVDIYSSPFIAKTDNSGNPVAPIPDDYSHGVGYHVSKTNDGNYLYASNVIPGFSVSKVNDTLTRIWTTGIVDIGGAQSVMATSDNGFITWGSSIFSAPDMALIKFDPAGAQQWMEYISGTETGSAHFAIQNAGGNYVVAGIVNENDSEISGDHGGDDGWVAMLGSDVGVPAVKNTADIKVYPVPAASLLFIDLPVDDANAELRLVDVAGRALLDDKSISLSRTMDLSKLGAGEYLLQVINAGAYSSYKVVHY